MSSTATLTEYLSHLYYAHDDWSDEYIVHNAYEDLGVVKDDFEDGFCPYKVLSRIKFIHGLESDLYTSDFTELPTSIRITQAVNKNLPQLKSDFPNQDEMSILKMAYDMARGVLNNSDFTEVEEEELYFEIHVEAENMEEFKAMLREEYGDDFTDDAAKAKFFAQDKPVSSSTVAEVGYERGKLRIFFKNGGGYEYPVPSSWYTQMLNSGSMGKFVWDTLRGRTPGRVIDNPNKMTPGGVGGSIVPYFKVKGARMAPDAMRKSVKGFLRSARSRKGAKVSGVPIQRISKPKYKAFKRFLKTGAGRFTPEKATKAPKKRSFKKIAKKAGKKVGSGKSGKTVKKKDPKKDTDVESKKSVKEQIKRLKKALKGARAAGLDDTIINAMEKRIATLEKSISDFIDYYNLTDDFVDDMKHFSGPITRAGEFQYNNQSKFKDYSNLVEQFDQIAHLPSFDSHNENSILGFAYNFTGDPETEQIFSEGYTFADIEETAAISLDSNTKLPVSIRFLDANEGTNNPEQRITDLIHLAISVNRTETDRCSSAGGNPCFIQFQDKQDFSERLGHQTGDFMAKKKEEEKEPPKEDKEDEEDEEDKEDKSKSSSDQAKEDPEMDAEYKSEEKNTKDFDDDKYMRVTKADWLKVNKEISDFATREKQRQAVVNAIELSKIKSDFTDKEQLYTLSSDFMASAKLSDFRLLQSALVKHNPAVDAKSQLFSNDFTTGLDAAKAHLNAMYKGGKK